MAERQPVASEVGADASLSRTAEAARMAAEAPQEPPEGDEAGVRREILRHVRQIARSEHVEEFSFLKLLAAIVQVLALLGLLIVFIKMLGENTQEAMLWALIAIALQLMSLTLFFGVGQRR